MHTYVRLSSAPLQSRSQTQGVVLPTFRLGALVTVSHGGVQGPPDPDSLSLRLPSRVILDCVNLTVKDYLSQLSTEVSRIHRSCLSEGTLFGIRVLSFVNTRNLLVQQYAERAVSFTRSGSQTFEQHSLNQRLICTQLAHVYAMLE